MTANSDYGVSIVESFVPPKNWLPGQEINKDVYAVNTGNIAAFVKETVSGKLNYTYESIVDDWAADLVTLDEKTRISIDGVTTNEAGGFLAWTNAKIDGYKVGDDVAEKGTANKTDIDSSTTGDAKTFTVQYKVGDDIYYAENEEATQLYIINNENEYVASDAKLTKTETPYPAGSINSRRLDFEGVVADGATDTGVVDPRWTPPATGDYIFRRAIDTSDANINDNTGTVKYTYAGYHYDADEKKYYKIIIGEDNYPTVSMTGDGKYVYDISADSTTALAGVTIDKDGIITDEDVKIRYVKLNEVVNATPILTYHNDNLLNGGEGPAKKYLEAYYTDDQGRLGQIAEKENEVEEAKAALADAQEKLDTASSDLAQKEVLYQDALGAYNSALSRYVQAKADYDYAVSLANATNALIDAANDRAAIEDAKDEDAEALKDAATDFNGRCKRFAYR